MLLATANNLNPQPVISWSSIPELAWYKTMCVLSDNKRVYMSGHILRFIHGVLLAQ